MQFTLKAGIIKEIQNDKDLKFGRDLILDRWTSDKSRIEFNVDNLPEETMAQFQSYARYGTSDEIAKHIEDTLDRNFKKEEV
jgi:hypothetical protein